MSTGKLFAMGKSFLIKQAGGYWLHTGFTVIEGVTACRLLPLASELCN